jgi:hypothetical protein
MLNKTGALRKNRFYHNAPFSILIFTRVFQKGLILISIGSFNLNDLMGIRINLQPFS